jgi:competence protein ComEC
MVRFASLRTIGMGSGGEHTPASGALVAPLVPPALALAAGIVADRYARPWGTEVWAALALLAAAGVGIGLWRCRRAGMLALLIMTLALGGGWHHACWSRLDGDDLAWSVPEESRPAWVRGVLCDVLGVHPGEQPITRAVLDVASVRDGALWRPVSGRALLVIVGDRGDLVAGEAVEAAGSLARLAGPLNPGEFNAREYYRAQGIRLVLSVDDRAGVWRDRSVPEWSWTWSGTRLRGRVRAWSHARLVAGLDARIAPLAAALLLGQREGVDPDVNDAFARTGTTHLLAISGLHLQALGFVLWFVFRAFGLGRRGAFAAVALATVAYALLVGLVPSVVRSAAMTLVGCAAGLFDRSARPANTLALAALATLGLNPSYLFDVGCQLSFLAIAAILWGSTPLLAWWMTPDAPLDRLEQSLESPWRRRVRSVIRSFVQMFIISLVVWLVTLPLAALRFHLAAPIGIVLNLPLIPLTTVALLASGLTLGLAAVWTPLGAPAAWVCGLCLRLTDVVVRWGAAARFGHAFVPTPSWIWVLGIYALLGLAAAARAARWPRPVRRGAWALLAAWTVLGLGLSLNLARFPRPNRPLEAEVLAVGHGLAVVVQSGDGHTWIYDCGRMRDPGVGRRIIAPALWARGVWHVDAVILSHADSDHYNGLPDLLDRFSVAAVRVPPGFASAANPGAVRLLEEVKARGVPVRPIAAGDGWEWGGARFTVWHPPRDEDEDEAAPPAVESRRPRPRPRPGLRDNTRSVVLDIEAAGHHALLTGDLEGQGLVPLRHHAVAPLAVLLAPHHGGRTSNPPWLYAWAQPSLVVVSQRPPMPGTTDPLAPVAARYLLLRTWERGAIRLTWTRSGVLARGFRDDQATWNE